MLLNDTDCNKFSPIHSSVYWESNKIICFLKLSLFLLTYKTVKEKSGSIRASILICQSDSPGRDRTRNSATIGMTAAYPLLPTVQQSRLFSVTWGEVFWFWKCYPTPQNSQNMTKDDLWLVEYRTTKRAFGRRTTSPSIILWPNSKNRPRNRQGVWSRAISAELEKQGRMLPLKGSYAVLWFVTSKRNKKSENKIKALEDSPQWWPEKCYKGGTRAQMSSPSRKIIYTVLEDIKHQNESTQLFTSNWWKIWPVIK